MKAWVAAVPVLATGLVGCGDLPRPFQNNPGAAAVRLAQPPPARLAVITSAGSLLPSEGNRAWAEDTAAALTEAEVPAVAERPQPGDWRLSLSAELRGGAVVPSYTVRDPKDAAQGSVQGDPVPAEAWASGAGLRQAAESAAPKLAMLLTGIEAVREQSDPNSLVNRPARVYVAAVRGAPGDGNDTLAQQMRNALPHDGEVVQPDPAGADYAVQGRVRVVPEAGHVQRVEIQWVVVDAQGREGGRIVQVNDIPAGTLDHYWGDVALVVAQQAAGGVRDVITNRLITHQKGSEPAKAAPIKAAPSRRPSPP